MHENEFEKRVQQKMEELQFAPSDAVWKNVDKEINKKEKRRPVFWLFFFLGLMLLGGGVYFITNNKTKKVEQLNGLKSDEVADKLDADKNETITKDEKKGMLDKKKENDKAKKVEKLNGLKAEKKVEELNQLKRKNFVESNKAANSIAVKASKSKSSNEKTRNINVEKNELDENGLKKNNNENVATKNSAEENVVTKETKKDIQDSSVNKTETIVQDNKKNIVADNKTVLADSSNDKKIARNNIKAIKSSSWKIGFHFDPGVSTIERSLFKSGNNSYALNTPTSGTTTPGVYSSPSKTEAGFSALVGISLNKTLSKHLFFSTGINYHYYSTSVSTGRFVDSGANVSSSYNSSITSQVNGYYVPGQNKYVNAYHFLELPLLINLQINKGDKIPIMWEAGVSVSYLISSNALHFDPLKNIYYKNIDLFNRTQMNAITSLMADLHVNKNELLVGPEIQYGFTRLLKNSTGNTQHLFYAGIKFSYILNKK